MQDQVKGAGEYSDSKEVYLYDPSESQVMHQNVFTDEYMDYLNGIDPEICSGIGYTRIVNMNLLRQVDGEVIPVTLSDSASGSESGMSSMHLSSYPKELKEDGGSYLQKNYDVLEGTYPESPTDMVLVVDANNEVKDGCVQKSGH